MASRTRTTLAATVALAVMLQPIVAAAQPECYRSPEIEADQAVRYQAELMVVSDSCGAESTYVHFRQHVSKLLVDYQNRMIEHFRRFGARHPESVFDSFITRLANEVALKKGIQPLSTVCADGAPLLATADSLDEDHFRQLISQQADARRPDYQFCATEKTVAVTKHHTTQEAANK